MLSLIDNYNNNIFIPYLIKLKIKKKKWNLKYNNKPIIKIIKNILKQISKSQRIGETS